MRALMLCLYSSVACAICLAQEVTLLDARNDLDRAKEELKKVVTMCRRCQGTGVLEQKPCPYCAGRGVMLEAEARLVTQRIHLEEVAEQKGVSKDKYAEFDIADRLPKYQKEIEPQAFEFFKAYVGYVNTYRKYQDLIDKDDSLRQAVEDIIAKLDKLIERHGPGLVVQSFAWLYEEDPVGKVGCFKLYGKTGVVRIDGQPYERFEMRTLKTHAVLVNTSQAKARKGFTFAEITGKGTYRTEDGKELQAILLRAY